MTYDVTVEQPSASRHLLVVRGVVAQSELSKFVPAACGKVWNVVRAKQIKGAGRHVAVYLDGEIRLEVGVELESLASGDGDVVASTMPQGSVATTTHYGPYNTLGDAHRAIQDWCKANGHTPAGPNWEIYGHWQDAWNSNPSLIRTDVYYLL